jgi:hypothetical protein
MTSTIKVNKIEKVDGSTIELGGPGTAVNLACGATQTGFGRTGTVDWCTTAKTSPFTAANGVGYFVNTCGGAITVTLPSSPSAGNIISIKDYATSFGSNNVTLCRNGSKIGGETLNATLKTNGDAITLVYVDATEGWVNVNTDDTVAGEAYVTATGGTITTCGNFKVHTFTGDGCFQVTNAGNAAGSNTVDYLVVAGGGGTSSGDGGGGGAGGYRESDGTSSGGYSVSPLGGCVSGLAVPVQTYPIQVGGGGAGGTPYPGTNGGANGEPSIFSTITSAGGGAAGQSYPASNPNFPQNIGIAGGSGGGGAYACTGPGSPSSTTNPNTQGGAGNTPPVSPPQGNPGGAGQTGYYGNHGGGGGATSAGGTASGPSPSPGGAGGNGGNGATSSITFSPVARGGGGGGPAYTGATAGTAGPGGGGAGVNTNSTVGNAGTVNTGGGAGGSKGALGAAGGSGIVVIRYKFQ